MNTQHPELKILFRHGKLLSYINTLCLELEKCLAGSDFSQLESLLNSVFQHSELPDFCEHYHTLSPSMDIYRRVLAMKRKLLVLPRLSPELKEGARAVLEALEHYVSSTSPWNYENNELKYMILPWLPPSESQPETEAVVFHYLYYEPVAVPDDHWLTGQFYSFKDQVRAVEYFESLVDEIKANLFLQERAGLHQRFDIPELRWPHYGIFFDGALQGKSYGGALMVLMLLGFIETLYGPKDHQFGGYSPATMIQAEIQPDGTVTPPDHLPLKLKAFLAEFGSRYFHLILADGCREELGLTYHQGQFTLGNHHIPAEKLTFVKNTRELFTAAFPRWKDLVALVWQKLSDSYRRNLFRGLEKEWTPEKVQQELLVPASPTSVPTWLNYTTAPEDNELKTAFHYSHQCEGIFDLRFGYEEGTFLINAGKDIMNEVVVIAVDGSSAAESLWSTERGKDSLIARTVFEILQNLTRKDRTFYLHFLSGPEPEILNVSRFTNPAELDLFMGKSRRSLNMTQRGNFLAPVLRYWWTRSLAPHKRIIIISNGPVYDHRDIDPGTIFWDYQWYCFAGANSKYLPHQHITMLNDIPGDVKEKLKVPAKKITRLELTFENWYPYEWYPADMVLKYREAATGPKVFQYQAPAGTAGVILNGMFLANTPLQTIDYQLEIKEAGGTRKLSGSLAAAAHPGLRCISTVTTGELPGHEMEIWEHFINSPGSFTCPVCDREHEPSLKCNAGNGSTPAVIFLSLRRFNGFAILEPHKKMWSVGKTGVKIDDYYFFKMNGEFHAFCPAKRSQPQPVRQGTITIGSRTFYLTEL